MGDRPDFTGTKRIEGINPLDNEEREFIEYLNNYKANDNIQPNSYSQILVVNSKTRYNNLKQKLNEKMEEFKRLHNQTKDKISDINTQVENNLNIFKNQIISLIKFLARIIKPVNRNLPSDQILKRNEMYKYVKDLIDDLITTLTNTKEAQEIFLAEINDIINRTAVPTDIIPNLESILEKFNNTLQENRQQIKDELTDLSSKLLQSSMITESEGNNINAWPTMAGGYRYRMGDRKRSRERVKRNRTKRRTKGRRTKRRPTKRRRN